MRVSDLITQLRKALAEHGDLPLVGNADEIREVRLTPCLDGVSSPIVEGTANELHLETMEF